MASLQTQKKLEKEKNRLEKEILQISTEFEKLMIEMYWFDKNINSVSIQSLFDLKKKHRLLGLHSLKKTSELKKALQEKIRHYEKITSKIRVNNIDNLLKKISQII